ncbi:MAG: EAL domain-containing response regulator [Acidobacteria bacterium]|nr:EAL domain-containing response regulator [Acidobacteriota bacterium]
MQSILIVDDDETVSCAVADALVRDGRKLILCSDLESAQLVIEREPPDCVITDIHLSGPFRYEGLDFIQEIKRRTNDVPVIVITGARTEALEREALDRGASIVLQKPFDIATLEAHLPASSGSEEASIERIPTLDEVLASPLLTPVFHPIVDISTGTCAVHGYESLARFGGMLFSNPQMLFDYASRKGRLTDLELTCVRNTFAHGASLNSGTKLFVNVHPTVIGSAQLADALATAVSDAGLSTERIVVEITEQASLGSSATVENRCRALRELGFSFALDDVGMAYSHLAHIEQIRPSYLKVSQDFGTDFEAHAMRTKIVKNVLSLAHDFGCELVLEGIETAETREAAQALGIRLGQGFLFARPAPASEF